MLHKTVLAIAPTEVAGIVEITHLKALRLAETSALAKAVNLFLLDCDARNLTPATMKFYWQRLGGFIAFCVRSKVTTLEGITSQLLRDFLVTFKNHSPYYAHQHARVLKTFCSFLVREGLLDASPMLTVRVPKLPKDVLPPFDAGEVHKLLEACENDRDRALVLTLLD